MIAILTFSRTDNLEEKYEDFESSVFYRHFLKDKSDTSFDHCSFRWCE